MYIKGSINKKTKYPNNKISITEHIRTRNTHMYMHTIRIYGVSPLTINYACTFATINAYGYMQVHDQKLIGFQF